MKKKINWGTGILIGIIIFILITVTMTIIFMNQDVSLVSDSYYEKSLVYQDEIDKQSRTKSLDEQVKINFDGTVITILFPSDYSSKKLTGEIYFYRPSDSNSDIKIPLAPDSSGVHVIPVESLEKGYWKIKVSWLSKGKDYFFEDDLLSVT